MPLTRTDLDAIDQHVIFDGFTPQAGKAPPWYTSLFNPSDLPDDLAAIGVVGFYTLCEPVHKSKKLLRSVWVVVREQDGDNLRIAPELHVRATAKYGTLSDLRKLPYWMPDGRVALAQRQEPRAPQHRFPFPMGTVEYRRAARDAYRESQRRASREYQRRRRAKLRATREDEDDSETG